MESSYRSKIDCTLCSDEPCSDELCTDFPPVSLRWSSSLDSDSSVTYSTSNLALLEYFSISCILAVAALSIVKPNVVAVVVVDIVVVVVVIVVVVSVVFMPVVVVGVVVMPVVVVALVVGVVVVVIFAPALDA